MDGMSWFGARLNRFLSLGDTGSVLALAELTGAANIDAYVGAAVVDAHLARGDDRSLCPTIAKEKYARFPRHKTLFFALADFLPNARRSG